MLHNAFSIICIFKDFYQLSKLNQIFLQENKSNKISEIIVVLINELIL
jgi:hypothetical protein